MKSSPKSKIIIFIALGILFALLPMITVDLSFIAGNSNKSSEFSGDINFDKEYLKISATSGKIHIINNSGWVDFKNAGNCTGDGTYSDPYVIEDLVINGGYLGSCILIENSDVYFRIENCFVFHSIKGIQLINVDNSLIISNNCSSNNYGISLSGCNNNTILGNTANNNLHSGIYVGGGGNNVSGNIANNNEYGIHVGGCVNNGNDTILGNTVNNNWYIGIYVWDGGNYTITGNIMNECGLRIEGSFEELISNYIDTTNQINGKLLYYYTNEVNLVENNFTNAGQVILVNCNDSLISNLNASYCTRGISLFYCNNNTISGNIANDNYLHGIILIDSNYNTVSGSTVNNNNYGIYLSGCNNSIISENTANNNFMGIIMYFSDYSTVSGNTANNNNYGIKLSGSDYNTISRNTANNNNYGIELFGSNYNTISGNNFLRNDECIVEKYCEGNIFENNDCEIIPGYNLFFILGTLSVVIVLISKKIKKF